MRDRIHILAWLLPLWVACDEPTPPPEPDSSAESKAAVEPEPAPESAMPRDAPAGQWSVEVYDDRLVWLDAPAATELALELSSGVVTTDPLSDGVRIDGIGRGAVAAQIGLRPGDVIRSIEGGPVTAAGLHDAWAQARRTEAIDLVRDRGGETTTIRLWLPRGLRKPSSRRVTAAVAYLGVRVLDESRRVIDRELLRALEGRGRLSADDTLWRSLGIPPHATVARIDDENLETDRRAALEAIIARADAKTFEVVVVDDEKQQTLQYEVDSGLIGQTALETIRSFSELERRGRPTAGGPSAEELDSEVIEVSESHYRIDKSFLSELMANPSALARQARIIPSQRDGEVVGFKLYGIRRGSLLGRLGFHNGDTVTAVNGQPITDVERAMEVYSDLRTAQSLKFDLIRKGEELTLQVDIE